MKRLEEKVKDIVEVRALAGLSDFLADPAATLNGYHFTDITAELMAKWVGQVADIKRGRGAAFALAGFRGVGKSHFLAALSAIVSQPELRAKIGDTHVMTAAQRLSRRHGVVAHLKRGSSDSLLSELKMAIAAVTDSGTGELSDSLNEILLAAVNKVGDTPFVLLIDTAFGRETRVARDDGALLSDIAAAAMADGVFVGLALDDDIAGADGLNSSIASSFSIDYLDQEHLYKIVDANVFPKHEQKRGILHDIYTSYRAVLPAFRWSEHRFSSLYPMHPAILEVAPFVRLYLQEFALLGFAVEAGIRILGRPANSLIGLDEVFDSIETRLRRVHDLKEAFAAYDALDRNVVAKTPAMKRLEAKLILKGLFLLSLNGEGVTAAELSAAMLIFDEADPAAGTASVEAILRAFSESMPDSIKKSENPDRDAKFAFKLGTADSLDSLLEEAAGKVSRETVELILRRQTAEKFSEFDISDDGSSIWATTHVVWRGSVRPGEVIWQAGDAPAADAYEASDNWKVFVRYRSALGSENAALRWPACEWVLGDLSVDDVNTIRRFHVLLTDNKLREDFRESYSTALHVHSIAVEKIWQRIFLEESHLVSSETKYELTDEATSSYDLAKLFAPMLDDQFEKQFPTHPVFSEILGTDEVSRITQHLFSGLGSDSSDAQKLAAQFMLPLGLVSEQDGLFIPQTTEGLSDVPIVKQVIQPADLERTDVISLDELSKRMAAAPYGLTQEAQHLVLAALVAQRQFEFVTSNGNRINHRSLDLQIIWEDIVGVARPSNEEYSSERLLNWAVLLTDDTSLRGLRMPQAEMKLIESLSTWLVDWQKVRIVEHFDGLPDEKLNSKLWRVASNVKKTFGVIAESVDGLLQDSNSLDKCLQTIADVFADSEDEFDSKRHDLTTLTDCIHKLAEHDQISMYLALCEPTGDADLEDLRCSLMDELNARFEDGLDAESAFKERWERFRTRYADLYIGKHSTASVQNNKRKKLDEFLGTDRWMAFAELSAIPWFGNHDRELATATIRKLRSGDCEADLNAVLMDQPFCACSFKLADSAGADSLIIELENTIAKGMEYFRQKILADRWNVTAALNEINDNGKGSRLEELVLSLEGDKLFPKLTPAELHQLKAATRKFASTNPLHSDRRRSGHEPVLQFDPNDLRELEDGMKDQPDPWKVNR